MIRTPRPYQLGAVKSIFRELSYRRSTMRIAATGSGKTDEQAMAGRVHLATGGSRVLHTAPRAELLQQAGARYLDWMPWLRPGIDIGFEIGERRAHSGQKVVLASLESLHDGRIGQIPTPDLIVNDECHMEIEKLRRLRDAFPNAKLVGWTATPDRLDAQRLLPFIYESVAARYELAQAIDDGYLVPFKFHRALTHSIRLDHLALNSEGDYENGELVREMMRPRNLHAVVNVTLERMEARPTIVFAVNRAHAAALVDVFNHYRAGVARFVDGTMKPTERGEILRQHKAGKFQVLISVLILTYGVDMPWLSHVVMARPTLSRNLYSQMIGRVLRLADLTRSYAESTAAGKADALITDLVGNSEIHTLVTPEDALDLDVSAIEKFEAPEDEDEEELIAEAVQAEIDQLLAEQKPPRAAGRADVAYELVPVMNQLSVVGIEIEAAGPNAQPARREQIDQLEQLGLQVTALLTSEQAAQVLEALQARRAAGLCTLKQAKFLQKWGLNPNVSYETAKKAFSRLESAGWQMTKALLLEFEKLRLIYKGTRTLVMQDSGSGRKRRERRPTR